MPMIPISNWYCTKCRQVVASEDTLCGRHCPRDPNTPRCKGEIQWRTVWIEAGTLQKAFDEVEMHIMDVLPT
jgi:NAD-dependent SIR2 family protein deacetylase